MEGPEAHHSVGAAARPLLGWSGEPTVGVHHKVGYSWGSLLATVKDQRVTFPEWTTLKPTTPLGQLLVLYWEGLEIPSRNYHKVGYIWGSLQAIIKDQRVIFCEGTALKPTTPLGQLPVLYWDGQESPQSGSITR